MITNSRCDCVRADTIKIDSQSDEAHVWYNTMFSRVCLHCWRWHAEFDECYCRVAVVVECFILRCTCSAGVLKQQVWQNFPKQTSSWLAMTGLPTSRLGPTKNRNGPSKPRTGTGMTNYPIGPHRTPSDLYLHHFTGSHYILGHEAWRSTFKK